MIERPGHIACLRGLLGQFPVVGLIGSRQVGKTTLAMALAAGFTGEVTRFDLENPRHLYRLEDPMFALESLEGLVILDEIQLRPELFPVLRVLADREGAPARFLVLGSASPLLLRQSSESLAGRIAYHELDGLSLDEVGMEQGDALWLRGGFPRSYLAESDPASSLWRQQFIRTYLERDLSELGIQLPSTTMRRFWAMLAHYHGEIWNGSELARAFGVSQKTVRGYLDTLCSTFMAKRLEPWHENLAKRQVKAPKIYLSDSGILHALLGLESRDDLLSHPKVGASWEGFAIGEVVAHLGARPEECFFWKLHSGAELDLLIRNGSTRRGFEIKLTTSPRVTPSMSSALENLDLEDLVVIHAGAESYRLTSRIRAVALSRLKEDVAPLR
ncbi:MAG TPA: ATP-binding protein [Thermoanaerobaculia bacterium]|nr:ATP-binding protein [Thermoanaerobaculia bacterium]